MKENLVPKPDNSDAEQIPLDFDSTKKEAGHTDEKQKPTFQPRSDEEREDDQPYGR